MIRRCETEEFTTVHEIINDAAEAYRGIIPADCWKEPYMSWEELQQEIESGVRSRLGFPEGQRLFAGKILVGSRRQMEISVVLADERWFDSAERKEGT